MISARAWSSEKLHQHEQGANKKHIILKPLDATQRMLVARAFLKIANGGPGGHFVDHLALNVVFWTRFLHSVSSKPNP